ncbi:DNA-directed RNA polymerase II 19 kDa polypeptide [Uncinocarpus reesii 1704]|uniref:DNA-directed RNA polymerase subunit n=1 Tax=Uncinocarpus reesii (strain UAMH 1704) TaxID=336963 RepID=C4JIV5_UNCRE|nr:DNA-directed RNA polymerase II 19 kDa polypeptide [Uncinocarpus reesii 1704]EEP76713.1 DNA-directed RNA polymerase II 19 kDa polypeptide [Uncinocarpus reesii 1704]
MYRAIVWKPFKGETVDAIVTSVKNQGIFAEVGPLTVFVSKHLIPPEIKWDPDATPPQYTDNADQVIEKGTNLRIKLIGLRNDVRNMFAIGSIKEDYLGITQFLAAIFRIKAAKSAPTRLMVLLIPTNNAPRIIRSETEDASKDARCESVEGGTVIWLMEGQWPEISTVLDKYEALGLNNPSLRIPTNQSGVALVIAYWR